MATEKHGNTQHPLEFFLSSCADSVATEEKYGHSAAFVSLRYH